MNLVDRYVAAVKRYLPESIRQDAGRELEGLLQEGLEALREKKGHDLQDDDIAQFLKDYGHPYDIASAYHGRRILVSEKAFPLYKRTLGFTLSLLLAGCIVQAWFLIVGVGEAWAASVAEAFLGNLQSALLWGFFLVTMLFYYFGEALARDPAFRRWDVRKLPAFEWANIDLLSTFVAAILAVSCLAVLTTGQYHYADATISVTLDDVARFYLAPLRVIVFVASLVFMVNLFQRYWTRTKLRTIGVLGISAALILLRIVLRPQIFVVSLGNADSSADGGTWRTWLPYVGLNVSLRIILAVIAATLLWRCAAAWRKSKTAAIPKI